MRLEKVTAIPEGLSLSPWSNAEFAQTTDASRRRLQEVSHSIWISRGADDRQLAVGGVYTPEGGLPEFWLLICEEFRKNLRQNLPVLRAHAEYVFTLYPRMIVRVDAKCPAGRKFTEYLGMKLQQTLRHGDREYLVFEVPN